MIPAPRHRQGFRTPRAFALAGSLLLLAGCEPGSPDVRIVNRSADTLTSLRIVGEKDSVRVHDVPPGATADVRAFWHGEDVVLLRGGRARRAGGEALSPMLGEYVEPGYTLRFEVDSTGRVHSKVKVPGY